MKSAEQGASRRILIVGSYFVPPAPVLLQVLPTGTPLYFETEPDNPYDPLAIKVWVLSQHLDREALQEKEADLNGRGQTIEGVLAEPSWPLGHVAASEGKPMLKARLAGLKGLVGTKELEGEDIGRAFLEFSSDGQFITARLEEATTEGRQTEEDSNGN